jgi:ureidoacrylate peracid hydrolase
MQNRTVQIPARPKPVEIDLARTSLLIVDMQNAFLGKSGGRDIGDFGPTGADPLIDINARLATASREVGVKVVYLQMGYLPDMSDAGGPQTPRNVKNPDRLGPESAEARLIEGTQGYAIVDALKPQPGDIVVRKTRFSGFIDTALDTILRTNDIRHLLVTGVFTNVCVESTIRSAYFLDYWPILISDATKQAGPSFIQDATIHNVSSYFGWVSSMEEVFSALR